MRYLLTITLLIALLAAPWLALNYSGQIHYITDAMSSVVDQLAAVIMHNPRTIAGLQTKYNSEATDPSSKVRILIVPGHEPDYGGAQFKDLKERDMTVELGQDMAHFLENDSHYQVFTARDTHSWTPFLSDYFKNSWNDIISWQKASHREESHLISVGSVTRIVPTVSHNRAPLNVAMRLYGMTKWSNENDIDIAIHIHFNDDPGHPRNIPGDHSGFAIYVPAGQYGNSGTTKAVADTIFKRLAKYNPKSDLPGESKGIIDEPDLIAVGANNTADAASMLIEYSYIYEPQFADPNTRSLALKDLAYQTYLGLQDFFDKKNVTDLARSYDTLILPHNWDAAMDKANVLSSDIYAMQTAFISDGLYPPPNKGMNDCPRSGKIGPCTKAAIEAFQNRYGIKGENGVVGPKTVEAMNRVYGVRVN